MRQVTDNPVFQALHAAGFSATGFANDFDKDSGGDQWADMAADAGKHAIARMPQHSYGDAGGADRGIQPERSHPGHRKRAAEASKGEEQPGGPSAAA
jgi:hypothetical protein